jgi:OmpA-OmpF porin, OOP family
MKTPNAASRRLPLSTLALCIALASSAASAQDSSWYIGASVGKTGTDSRTGDMEAAWEGAGYGTNTLQVDDKNTGWKALGGYSFNEHLALEASYADLGDVEIFASLAPAASQHVQASMRGASLDLVGSLPLSPVVSAFARVGVNNLRIRQTFSNSAISPYFTDSTERGTNAKYGFGMEFNVSDAFSVRAEAERFHVDGNRVTDDRIDMFSLGVVYRFGRRSAPVAAAPAPAPAPAPAQTPAPQRAAPVTITLEASALFDFDRAELRPQGRTALDELVRDLDDVSYEVIIVTGHTDRIGSHEYNLALSERRANAVRDYLVSAGIPSDDITARGVNSDQPVTTAQQCQGPVTNELIACLQPDRRVEVEVRATRDPE